MNTRIRELRNHYGLSQTEFAKRIGMTRSIVSNMELGQAEVPDYRIESMLKEFPCSEKWLRYGIGSPEFGQLRPAKELVDKIVDTYGNGSHVFRSLLEAYLEMTETQQEAFDAFVENFVENYHQKSLEVSQNGEEL